MKTAGSSLFALVVVQEVVQSHGPGSALWLLACLASAGPVLRQIKLFGIESGSGSFSIG